MATVAPAIPRPRRLAYGRALLACVSAWIVAVVLLAELSVVARGLSAQWLGEPDPASPLGFFTSSASHPLGLYGLATVAVSIAIALRVALRLQTGTSIAWWSALAVGALGAAGTRHPTHRGVLVLVLLAAWIVAIGAGGSRRTMLPGALRVVAVVAWIALGTGLFVMAGKAVAAAPLRVVFDGTGSGELIGLTRATTPPLRLIVHNRSASPIVVRSVRIGVRGAGAYQSLVGGALPSGAFTLPAPIARSFTIAPRTDIAIGASWRSVCHTAPPGRQGFTVTLRIVLEHGTFRQSRQIAYDCAR